MVRGIAMVLVAGIFVCCETIDIKGLVMPTGDVVDKRFEKSMSLTDNKAVANIEAKESYTFYVCADPHIDNTNENLREFSTRLRNSKDAMFGIVLGDCYSRISAMPTYIEALKYVPGVQATDTPIFSLLGNHDIYHRGWDKYSEQLGASVYWFDVQYATGGDLFIALDSASGTLGKQQMDWLRKFLAEERDKYRHCVILTHTNLFYTDNSQLGSSNMALEETAALTELFSRHRVTLCLQGHDHYREDLVLGGVRYTIVGTISDNAQRAEYLSIRLSDKGAEYSWEYI